MRVHKVPRPFYLPDSAEAAFQWSIHCHESVSSTQELVKAFGAQGAAEGQVVQAAEQVGGYGRHGRGWVSPKGNLYLSILLRPECSAMIAPQLALVAGLASARAVQDFVLNPDLVHLKWPNDVFLDGKKCSGLLIETELKAESVVDWVVLGVGLNVRNAPEDIGAVLCDYVDEFPELDQVRDIFLSHLARLYHQWLEGEFSDIRESWLEIAHPQGTAMKIKLGESLIEGYFQGLDENGNLIVKDAGGVMRTIASAEIYI